MKLVFPLSTLLLTVGCLRSVTPPSQHQPDLPIPGVWSENTGVQGDVKIHWWTQFRDPQLNTLVKEALRNNRQLRAASRRLEIALTEAQIAGANLVPSVGISLNGRRQRQNFIGFPIPGSKNRVPRATFTNLGVALDISWEADLWGKIRAGELQAGALASAQAYDLAAIRHSLAAQTAKGWFASSEALLQLKLAQNTAASYLTSSQWIRNRFEKGLQTALDLRLVLSDLSVAESLVSLRRDQLDRTIRQVEILAGRYPSGSMESRNALPILSAGVPAGLPSQLLTRRPDLMAARQRLLASDASILQNQAALHPRLTLTTSGGTATNALLNLVDGNFTIWSLLGNLIQPLFQGGQLRNQVKASKNRSQELLEEYAEAVLQAFAEVETTLGTEYSLKKRLLALQEATTQARARNELLQLRYQHGLGDILAVLETQRRIYNSESETLTIRRLLLDNRIDLHLALGGGFDPGSPDTLTFPPILGNSQN